MDKVNKLGERDKQTYVSSNFKYRIGKQPIHRSDESVTSHHENDQIEEADDEQSIKSLVEFHNIADDVNEIMDEHDDITLHDEHTTVSEEDT